MRLDHCTCAILQQKRLFKIALRYLCKSTSELMQTTFDLTGASLQLLQSKRVARQDRKTEMSHKSGPSDFGLVNSLLAR